MLTYSNITRHLNVPFDKYLNFPGYSFSFLKREVNGVAPEFIGSDKVKLGSLVDAILTQDEKIDYEDPQFNRAMQIAIEIKDKFGTMIKSFVPQVSYTGTMEYKGFKIVSKGRLDWELLKLAVVDLKVTAAKDDKAFKAFIEHMGYGDQLFNYCGLSGTKRAYILPYSTTAKRCLSIVNIPIGDRNEFWEEKVLKFGTV